MLPPESRPRTRRLERRAGTTRQIRVRASSISNRMSWHRLDNQQMQRCISITPTSPMCRASLQPRKELNRAGTRKRAVKNRPLRNRSKQQSQNIERPRTNSGAAFVLPNESQKLGDLHGV